jgi:hypothetical protein
MSTTVEQPQAQAARPATRERTIAAPPVILAGCLAQLRLVRGLAMGAVK